MLDMIRVYDTDHRSQGVRVQIGYIPIEVALIHTFYVIWVELELTDSEYWQWLECFTDNGRFAALESRMNIQPTLLIVYYSLSSAYARNYEARSTFPDSQVIYSTIIALMTGEEPSFVAYSLGLNFLL